MDERSAESVEKTCSFRLTALRSVGFVQSQPGTQKALRIDDVAL